LLEPVNIFVAFHVAILFFADEAEWRAGDDKIDRFGFKRGHVVEGVSSDDLPEFTLEIGFHLACDASV
jgi:hypothetical protein